MGEHGSERRVRGQSAQSEEFQAVLEARRVAEPNDEEFGQVRRGWRLGSAAFRQNLLDRFRDTAGEHHTLEIARENAQSEADRIILEHLARLGWSAADLKSWRHWIVVSSSSR